MTYHDCIDILQQDNERPLVVCERSCNPPVSVPQVALVATTVMLKMQLLLQRRFAEFV